MDDSSSKKRTASTRAMTPGAVAVVYEPPVLEPELSDHLSPPGNTHNGSTTKETIHNHNSRPAKNTTKNTTVANNNSNNMSFVGDMSLASIEVPDVVEPDLGDDDSMMGRRPRPSPGPSPAHSPVPMRDRKQKQRNTPPAVTPGAVSVRTTNNNPVPPTPTTQSPPGSSTIKDRKQRRGEAAIRPGAVAMSVVSVEEPGEVVEPGSVNRPPAPTTNRSPPGSSTIKDRKQRRGEAATRPGAVSMSVVSVEEPGEVVEPGSVNRPPVPPTTTPPSTVLNRKVLIVSVEEPEEVIEPGSAPPTRSPPGSSTIQDRKQRRGEAATRTGDSAQGSPQEKPSHSLSTTRTSNSLLPGGPPSGIWDPTCCYAYDIRLNELTVFILRLATRVLKLEAHRTLLLRGTCTRQHKK